MKREYRSNWTRHHGGRPPPAVSDRWEYKGLAAGRAPLAFDDNPTVQRATEEMRLTVAPKSRYRSLLVPVDGGPFGEHALPLALGIARRAGAEVRVVYVHSPLRLDQLYPDSGLDAFHRRRQQAYLDNLVRRLAKITSVPVTPLFLQGREIADSLHEAASAGTDLVVMATHGRGPLGRFWFGSVADVLMRRLSVPLLLVRGYNAPADLTGEPLLRHVLVPLDGSELSEPVLEPALAVGTLTGADHTLLRVLPWVTDYSLAYPGTGLRPPLADGQRAEALDYLRRTTDRLARRGQRVHPRIVRDEESVARAILHYARTHDVDLIALATRGRGGLARLFRGSVAERVVRGASMPVLVCRPHAAEQEGNGIP